MCKFDDGIPEITPDQYAAGERQMIEDLRSKLSKEKKMANGRRVRCIPTNEVFASVNLAEKEKGISRNCLYLALRNGSGEYKGQQWEFLDPPRDRNKWNPEAGKVSGGEVVPLRLLLAALFIRNSGRLRHCPDDERKLLVADAYGHADAIIAILQEEG